MVDNTWKLPTPPDAPAHVDEEVLALRAPLVRVHRTEDGTWCFDGHGAWPRSTRQIPLGAVVQAWPHVCALSPLEPGAGAVWSWHKHGWAREFHCTCGTCESPKPADLDRGMWPEDMEPDRILNVEQAVLTGQTTLTDMRCTSAGVSLHGPAEQERQDEAMTPVAAANAVRRWPHTMRALQSLNKGRGMYWDGENLNWREYRAA